MTLNENFLSDVKDHQQRCSASDSAVYFSIQIPAITEPNLKDCRVQEVYCTLKKTSGQT